jgi:putative component of toxin-antitoxin plasmid stabilization module
MVSGGNLKRETGSGYRLYYGKKCSVLSLSSKDKSKVNPGFHVMKV